MDNPLQLQPDGVGVLLILQRDGQCQGRTPGLISGEDIGGVHKRFQYLSSQFGDADVVPPLNPGLVDFVFSACLYCCFYHSSLVALPQELVSQLLICFWPSWRPLVLLEVRHSTTDPPSHAIYGFLLHRKTCVVSWNPPRSGIADSQQEPLVLSETFQTTKDACRLYLMTQTPVHPTWYSPNTLYKYCPVSRSRRDKFHLFSLQSPSNRPLFLPCMSCYHWGISQCAWLLTVRHLTCVIWLTVLTCLSTCILLSLVRP